MASFRRIGIYGGSFDPIHLGHLIQARDAVETFHLDRLFLIPVNRSPFHPDEKMTDNGLRADMVNAAVRNDPQLFMDGRELHRPPPSYTIDTVREIAEEHPGAELFLFIGADNLDGLERWKDIHELRALATMVVFARRDADIPADFPQAGRYFDLSSTEIRKRVAEGLPVDYFLHPSVADIIKRERLYLEPDE